MKSTILLFLCSFAPALMADLPRIGGGYAHPFAVRNVYGDHMVVQRERPVRVAGTATAYATVSGSFAGSVVETRANGAGDWTLEFPPKKAGGPFRMTFETLPGREPQIVFDDVLVGDVWLATGQSNMEFPVWCEKPFFRLKEGAELARTFRDDGIRAMVVPNASCADGPCRDLPGRPIWRPLDSSNAVAEVSAVGFYFAVTLRKKLATRTGGSVPIGIIHSNWGGSAIQPWIPEWGYLEAGKTGESSTLDRWAAPLAVTTNWLFDAKAERWNNNLPTTLWNAMLAPFTAMNVKGAIWYQGCTNWPDPNGYRTFQKILIESWRKAWRDPSMPVVIAELSSYYRHSPRTPQTNDFWRVQGPDEAVGFARFRQMQSEFVSYPHASCVPTFDVGEHSDIHPKDKKTVGVRMAHEALRIGYGDSAYRPAPRAYGAVREGDAAIVSFTDVGAGLVAIGETFEDGLWALEDANVGWKWAKAELRADSTVKVAAEDVSVPLRVRYAFRAYHPSPNLRRKGDGMPVFGFEIPVKFGNPAFVPGKAIKVGTSNVKCPAPWDKNPEHHWSVRNGLLFAQWRTQDPDVLGLQEPVREYLDDILGAFPGWTIVGEGREGGLKGEYSPIAYRTARFDCLTNGTFWLSGRPYEVGSKYPGAHHPRICTYVYLREKTEGRVLVVYNSHTSYESASICTAQLGMIVDHLRIHAPKDAVVVLTGDLNFEADSEALRPVVASGLHNADDVCQSPLDGLWNSVTLYKTYPKSFSAEGVRRMLRGGMSLAEVHRRIPDLGARIDHIWVSPNCKVLSCGVDGTNWGGLYPSDHMPKFAVIAL